MWITRYQGFLIFGSYKCVMWAINVLCTSEHKENKRGLLCVNTATISAGYELSGTISQALPKARTSPEMSLEIGAI